MRAKTWPVGVISRSAAVLLGATLILFASARPSSAQRAVPQNEQEFSFVQLSDTHWGFDTPAVNPDFAGTLKKAIADVNALKTQPDFVVFTGDLTHTTDSNETRRTRMTEFKEIIKGLRVQEVHFLPGEHDAGLDNGKAFQEFFGPTHWTFDHKGVHFIALDNVSDPRAQLGEEQLKWLEADLQKLDKTQRIVVFTHRPLFDLAPDWDWATRDGAKALTLLAPYQNVTVFYGHIHQINNHTEGHIDLHSAMGLMYPLPAPHSVPKKAPIPWDPAQPYKGLGFRQVDVKAAPAAYTLTEFPVVQKAEDAPEQVIRITAKRFTYTPDAITLKKGVPVTLEFTSQDVMHGFNCPDLNIRADIEPGKTARVSFTPQKAGKFEFHCDIFCGTGHGNMGGTITVTE